MRPDLDLTDEEIASIKRRVRRLREWIRSDEGGRAIRAATERSLRAAKKREREQRADPLELIKPTTI